MNDPKVEEKIRECLSSGDHKSALEVAIGAYAPQLFSFIRFHIPNREDAEDVFSNLCETLIRNMPSFRGESSYLSWAMRCAERQISKFKSSYERRHKILFQTPDQLERLLPDRSSVTTAEPPQDPRSRFHVVPNFEENDPQFRQIYQELRNALRMRDRELLSLRLIEDLDWTEIAKRQLKAEGKDPSQERLERRVLSDKRRFLNILERLFNIKGMELFEEQFLENSPEEYFHADISNTESHALGKPEKKTKTLQLVLDADLSNFSYELQQKLIRGLARFLSIPINEISIVGISLGSVIVTITLPDAAAEQLLRAVEVRDVQLLSNIPVLVREIRIASDLDAICEFSWIHISDMHFGHPDISHRWDQTLVMDRLLVDISAHENVKVIPPEAIFITGDIAFSGNGLNADEYRKATLWITKLGASARVAPDGIFVVPGNHDINRSVGIDNNVRRLLAELRTKRGDLDKSLQNTNDYQLLLSRMSSYLEFARSYAPATRQNPPLSLPFWKCYIQSRVGLKVRIVGLNTSFLCADDKDQGRIKLGKAQLACVFNNDENFEQDLSIILSHHPFKEGWLQDQREVDGWVRRHAHIHLHGHVHEADSEECRSGFGEGFVRVVAGAAHGDKMRHNIPAGHGYNFSAIVKTPDGKRRLRVWPRLWSDPNKTFVADIHRLPPGKNFAEHMISSPKQGPHFIVK